ncbi:MAG: GNAT family N-acetyltransferase [Gemmatimonadales bacterium]|nr:GNAT family N-acetyltransferase [Gemmatimonadales bacterium]
MSRIGKVLALLGVRYEVYRIMVNREPSGSAPLSLAGLRVDQLERIVPPAIDELQQLNEYAGEDSIGFGAWIDGQLVAVCWYWYGERYRRERGFIPLPDLTAKLVQVTVDPSHRGKGIAPILIAQSSRSMSHARFKALYARIWHSNTSSRTAFAKAGWSDAGSVITVKVPLLQRPFRFSVPRPHKGSKCAN